jgi:hypothetical protein
VNTFRATAVVPVRRSGIEAIVAGDPRASIELAAGLADDRLEASSCLSGNRQRARAIGL